MKHVTAGLTARTVVLSLLSALLVCGGCVKRAEIIAVLPNGTALLATAIDGDERDVATGDALPSIEAGWQVSERTETDDEGKVTVHRVGQYRVASGDEFPTTYASRGSVLESLALTFFTKVNVERRRDGTYYHFRRVYHGRHHAAFEAIRQERLESDDIKKILEKPPETMTEEEQAKVAEAIVVVDRDTRLMHFQSAMVASDALIPQDAMLRARAALIEIYRDDSIVKRTTAVLRKDDKAGPGLEALNKEIDDRIEREVRKLLTDAGTSKRLIHSFLQVYAQARLAFEITKDLGDDCWIVAAILPGHVVGHNAGAEGGGFPGDDDPGTGVQPLDLDDLKSQPHGELVALATELADLKYKHGFSIVIWDFEGKELFDRDVVLLATSFVPRGDHPVEADK